MKILIVDDDREVRSLLRMALEADCFTVDEAEDGERGVFLGKINEYDLLILDLQMPKKSGQEVCAELRAAKKQFPILILSVVSEVPSKVMLLDMGADDYLTKPFSIDELLARVRSLLRRGGDQSEDILLIDDLTLDVKKHVVTRAGREIYLTRKEFALLEYLLKNKENVMTRAMIMEHVWDMNADPFSNTIETHILSLRKKLDYDAAKKLIHTISGRGYKIAEK